MQACAAAPKGVNPSVRRTLSRSTSRPGWGIWDRRHNRANREAQVHDTVIKGGTIYDGTGAEPFTADVAIAGGRITAVGKVDGPARETIDATGLMVTPGFVDIHTHYDGQATWAERISPSSTHGVTTVVTGNCGVGFAPCRPEDRDELVRLMEGVEDIPGLVLTEGLSWNWESFPDYLDAIEQRPHDVDIAAQLPHSALRVYVMGERAIRREPATAADSAAMAKLAHEAVKAGALGFTTSRSLLHKTKAGESVPSLGAEEAELTAIALGVRDAGPAVLELSTDYSYAGADLPAEIGLYRRLAETSGMPISLAIAFLNERPDLSELLVREVDAANAAGVSIKLQTVGRSVGVLQGFDLSMHPFAKCPTYRTLEALPMPERARALAEPSVRAKIVAEAQDPAYQIRLGSRFAELYPLGDPPNYEPRPEDSVAGRAKASGEAPEAVLYDMLMRDDGHGIVYLPLTNYSTGDFDGMAALMKSDNTLIGLGDGGAHVGMICDASQPTFLLSYWGRDRKGERLDLPFLIKALTSTNAKAVGLDDRGVIAPGYKADLNLIDFGRLRLRSPRAVYDLPAGGRRLTQDAEGYVATFVSGQVTYREGEATGALPGRLVRGAQPAPN
jgi:N-acyl-D-aspartate/D-glutamate deacylase